MSNKSAIEYEAWNDEIEATMLNLILLCKYLLERNNAESRYWYFISQYNTDLEVSDEYREDCWNLAMKYADYLEDIADKVKILRKKLREDLRIDYTHLHSIEKELLLLAGGMKYRLAHEKKQAMLDAINSEMYDD